jgi:hypothetical protein
LIQSKAMLGQANVSPDGRYVATVIGDAVSGSSFALVLVPTAGGEVRELIRGTELALPKFSPDGRYIATSIADPITRSRVAMLFSIDGGRSQELMRAPAESLLGVAMWATDCRSVLLRSRGQIAGQPDWWRVSVENLKSRKLEVGASRGGTMLVSPNGHHVALVTPESPKKPTEIWVMENFLPASKAGE